MPFQVSGQLVTKKSSTLPHAAGCGGALVVAAGAVFVTMMSSAEAFVAYAATASPRIIAVETSYLFILVPPDPFGHDRSRSSAGPRPRFRRSRAKRDTGGA